MLYTSIVAVVIMIHNAACVPAKPVSQSRNVAFQFRDMITRLTGRSAFDYLGYGCHCGLGGGGKTVDAIDQCCQVHDQCYASTSAYLQFWNLCSPHLVDYAWKLSNRTITCTNSPDTCRYKTCMCDKIVAECFARHPYNYHFKGHSQRWCS